MELSIRLQAVADLVSEGMVVADIGTDHGYIPIYLVENGKSPKAFAMDVNKGPLLRARDHIQEHGLLDKIETRQSDGAKNLTCGECDAIVIAGMGGILISEILDKAKWVFDNRINIVAQPMTHADVLRKYLVENGFSIIKEKTAADSKHCYCAISAVFTGEKCECPDWYSYIGETIKNNDEITKRYVMKVYSSLKKKYNALSESGRNDETLFKTLNDIERKIKEAGLWLP
jgi:tRNA (adenine22-N1)-methyltransferase